MMDCFIYQKNYQYYTKIVSQVDITKIHYGYFFVWTMKDLLVEKITFNEKLWENVKTNLEIFCKLFAC